jgi:patatin-like phospholipase/acyl hydrolase
MDKSFNILSLNGGGIRGLFQAVFLNLLKQELGNSLYTYFDLIAGTSTGAIIGMALALEIDPLLIVDMYKKDGSSIFKKKLWDVVTKGGRYDQSILKSKLESVFDSKQLRDCKTNVLFTATSIDRFTHRIFTNSEEDTGKDLLATDVVLSSSAAPTYFNSVKLSGLDSAFVDGGMWVNNPALLAVLYANNKLKIPLDYIKLISIGTGETPQGLSFDEFNRIRPYSLKSVDSVLSVMFNSQTSYADEYMRLLVDKNNRIIINPTLKTSISMDDTLTAIAELPPLAESEFNREKDEIKALIGTKQSHYGYLKRIDFVPEKLIIESGISAFYPSRDYYAKFRKDCSTIDKYINTATSSIKMISLNLMTGIAFTDICNVIKKKLSIPNFQVTISLLDPGCDYLMKSIAPVLGKTEKELSEDIYTTITKLFRFRKGIKESLHKKRFILKVHKSLPFGSAIMIDTETATGKIQIETKPYKAILNKSFGFEVINVGKDCLYTTLSEGYTSLLDDGDNVTEKWIKKHKTSKNESN